MFRQGNSLFIPVILGTGLGAYNVARCLHEAYGVRSLCLGRAPLPETKDSRIVDVIIVPTMNTSTGVCDALNKVRQREGERLLLVIPTIEFYTNVLSEARDQLPHNCVVPGGDPTMAGLLLDKIDFYDTCSRYGLKFPAYLPIKGRECPSRNALMEAGITFPLILKPTDTDVYPRISFSGKKKVYLVETETELRDTVTLIRDGGYDRPLVAQRYIPGDESVMKVCNTYSSSSGTVTAACAAQVALTDRHPERVGNNNALIATPAPEVVRPLCEFLDSIGYTGFANADFLFDNDTGEYVILELNLRLGATAFYTMAASLNLVRAMVEDLVYDSQVTLKEPSADSLWLNVPFIAALMFTPLRGRLLGAARQRVVHTLHYRPDMSLARLRTLAGLDARMLRDTFRHRHQKLNSTSAGPGSRADR